MLWILMINNCSQLLTSFKTWFICVILCFRVFITESGIRSWNSWLMDKDSVPFMITVKMQKCHKMNLNLSGSRHCGNNRRRLVSYLHLYCHQRIQVFKGPSINDVTLWRCVGVYMAQNICEIIYGGPLRWSWLRKIWSSRGFEIFEFDRTTLQVEH